MTDDKILFGHLRALLQSENGRQRFCKVVLAGGERSLADAESLRIAIRRVMPYRAFLGTKYWAERSRNAKERAGHRCQLCNSKAELNTHHRTYDRRGNEDDSDLTVLCAACHEKFHAKQKPDEYGNPEVCVPEDLKWVGMTPEEESAELCRLIAAKRREHGIPTVATNPKQNGIPPYSSILKRSGT